METYPDSLSLKSYIQQYHGNTRYVRLLVIADKQFKLREEALKLCFEMAKTEKKLYFYFEALKILKRAFQDKLDQQPLPDFGQDPNFERTVQQEYRMEVKKKDQEIQQLQKSLLKDSIRIAMNELGNIHYQYGFTSEAIKAWIKSHDFSTQEDDLFNISFQIAQAAYESMNLSYLIKYSGEAEARDKLKNQKVTMQIKILDGLSSLLNDNHSQAAAKFSSIQVVDTYALLKYISQQDLAYYVIVCSLSSMKRSDLKSQIMNSSNYKNIMEQAPNASETIESLLNGRYMEFLTQLNQIQVALKFDPFLGHKIGQIIGEIRKKALIQYVTPYKVIDMREIAKAFDLSIEQIEAEIADLIVSKKIQAKIDSHSKLLYSRKDNDTLNSYKEAVALGRMFIRETEQAILRVQAFQMNKVLKGQNLGLTMEPSNDQHMY
ncbi:cop9 signalosome complex subunit 1 [Stylonychia lemnae]|uniref:Cop9 signalosome complex subunit 1 n=1 Tax=Stylonychia lemnae TaxID=5949 RepID=A0A078A3K8_STYLE|nr:cop9 signalosome complex subunit 1 [Stylonychia lemnae]|eukprot:CDW76767.1 cop9 signalosome complex subunit 1 [Stylonychia lemnae]